MAIDWNKPVQRKCGGNRARVVCMDAVTADDRPVCILWDNNGSECSALYRLDGTIPGYSDADLINVPEERFVVVHRHHTGSEYISGILKSRADAELQLITYLAHGRAEIYRLVPA